MINDQKLHEYLNEDITEELVPVYLDFITPDGTLLPEWAIRFNQMTEDAMYHELLFVIRQLMVMAIDETHRLNLMYEITKVGQVLISKLHMLYWNQVGLLNEEQQNALDRVLSIYYTMVIFYYSIWQRLANQIDDTTQTNSGLSIFKRFTAKPTTTSKDIVKRCIFSIMVLLKQALLEKQVGYRQDTQVIWQYLNACYTFARGYGWLSYSFNLDTLLNYSGKLSIEQIYHQCLLADLLQPYAYRRYDLIKFHRGLIEWGDYLQVTEDAITKPYLYVNLHSNEGPKLLTTADTYNPFAASSQALFINLQPIFNKLTKIIEQPTAPNTTNNPDMVRLAKLAYPNLEKALLPPPVYIDQHETCQIVVGFLQIHFILAGKTSLDNLIHSHQLPEQLRPSIQTGKNFDKPSEATLLGNYQHTYKLYFPYLYKNLDIQQHTLRTPNISSINQFQVNSMIATYVNNDQGTKSWQFGKILQLKQQPAHKIASNDSDKNTIGVELQVALLGKGTVPCGVRLLNPDSRLPRFMPALIIPKSEELGRPATRLMMSRFGYQVGDKVIIRIDSKEVKAQLTELVSLTDDTEEYNFVRIV